MEVIKKTTILVIDDSPQNLLLLTEILSRNHHVIAANSGLKGIELCQRKLKPDLIILDVIMPGMDGFEVCKELKRNGNTSSIPIIFVTAKSESIDEQKGFALGAVDYIQKPVSPAIVKARVNTHIRLFNQTKHLQELVDEQTKELKDTQLKIIERLGRAAEYNDNETGMHVIRMSKYAYLIAQHMGLEESWCNLLCHAAPMHDIGKIGVCQNILRKAGKLDDNERHEMNKHCEIGANIIGDDSTPVLSMAKEVALYHHERWDGEGYPFGLEKNNIPLSAQIVAIADVFDALTSLRPYKPAWSIPDAIALIKEGSGTQFSPLAVEGFLQALPDMKKVMDQYKETGMQICPKS